MPNANLNKILSSLYDGSRSLFVDYLGFPLKEFSSDSFTLPGIASDCKSDRIYDENVTDVKIIGFVPCDNCTTVDHDLIQLKLDSIHITVIALELSTGFYPSLNWIKDYTRFINNSFYNGPVLVMMTYGGSMVLSLPVRREGLTVNEREKVAKMSVLKGISLSNPSKYHQAILKYLKLNITGTGSLEELFEEWQDKFAVIDTELLVNDFKALFKNHMVFMDWKELSSTIIARGKGLIRYEYNTLYDFFLSDAFKDYHQDAVVYMEQLLRKPIEDFISKFGIMPRPETVASWFTVQDLPLINKSEAVHFLKYDRLSYVEECLDDSLSKSADEVKLPLREHSDEEVGACLLSGVATIYGRLPIKSRLKSRFINRLLAENVVEDNVQAFMELTLGHFSHISDMGKGKMKIVKEIKGEIRAKANLFLSLCEHDKNNLEEVYGDLIIDLPVARPIVAQYNNLLSFLCHPRRFDIDLNELTVGKIMTTRLVDVLKLPSTGASRVLQVIHLRQMLNDFFVRRNMLEEISERLGPWYGKIEISFASIPLVLRNNFLELLQDNRPTVEFFLAVSESRFRGGKLTAWLEFRRKLIDALSLLTVEGYLKGSNKYFRRTLPEQLSTNLLDFLLSRDLAKFFDQFEDFSGAGTATNRDETILKQRLGYMTQRKKLQQISKIFGCTRERVRQIEDSLYQKLKWIISIPASDIKLLLEEFPLDCLELRLPKIFELFQKDADALKIFFKKLVNVEWWDSSEIDIGFRDTTLKNFWNGAKGAARGEDIIHFLQGQDVDDEEERTLTQARNFFVYLKQRGEFKEIAHNQYLPRRLCAATAVAFVLKDFPQGLGWRDIYRVINNLKLTRKPINDDRRTPDAKHFSENPLIFVADFLVNGSVYKHIDFFYQACGEDERRRILQDAIDYLNISGNSSVDLRTFHRVRQSHVDYYILRQVVRVYGQDYGLLWDGASKSDNFYLNSASYDRSVNKDRVLELLKSHPFGMTKGEVSAKLHRSHHMLASVTLGQLYASGEAMKVTQTHYVATEDGLSKFNNKIDQIKKIFSKIFAKQRKGDYLIEASYLRDSVNNRLGTFYNKAIISSLAKHWSITGELSIYCKRHMFSSRELPYDSMRDLIHSSCDLSWELWQVKEQLSKIIWSSDFEYGRAWNSYRTNIFRKA